MNVLIIGIGSIALKHIDAIRKITVNAVIYALRSKPNANIHQEVINIYDLDSCNINFDFAIISNPTNLHFKFIEILIKKGINIFIEKPPVNSLQNYNKLLKYSLDYKVINYVACNLRFHPCLQFLKKEMKTNTRRINEINVYCGSFLPDWRPMQDFKKTYSAIAEMGGGVHLDLYHELDYTTWIFGIPNSSHSIFRNVSTLKIDSIDYANYLLEYDSFAANIVLNYYRKDPKRILEIIFEDETWTVDLINNKIKGRDESIIFEIPEFSIINTYHDQMRYFIDHIRLKKNTMNSIEEAYEVLKICLKNE
jgi:predicted dehydrogenase